MKNLTRSAGIVAVAAVTIWAGTGCAEKAAETPTAPVATAAATGGKTTVLAVSGMT